MPPAHPRSEPLGVAVLAVAALLACGDRSGGSASPPDGGAPPAPGSPGWVVVSREDFESGGPPAAPFAPDPVPDDGPFSDGGAYFASGGVVPPRAFHYPAWMEIWNGSAFLWSGAHPVMMFALDGSRPADEKTGSPFLSWSADAWQASGAIRAVDAYLPGTWYRATIERDGPRYAIELSGRFLYGGERTYRAELDAAAACVWHYPATADEAAGASRCVDESGYRSVGPEPRRWPAGGAWPDWFMLGDPHVNFYEGEVLSDDLTLEVWK